MRCFINRGVTSYILMASLFAVDCRFDPSVPPGPIGAGFAGCFETSNFPGIELRLDHTENELLSGSLVIGFGAQVYAVDGRALTDNEASLDAVLAGGDGSKIVYTAILASANILSLQTGNSPPSQLVRCP